MLSITLQYHLTYVQLATSITEPSYCMDAIPPANKKARAEMSQHQQHLRGTTHTLVYIIGHLHNDDWTVVARQIIYKTPETHHDNQLAPTAHTCTLMSTQMTNFSEVHLITR